MTLKTRIAPTPSGFLHIGNAFSFLLTWLIARRQGGTVHLRIDDIDSDRVRPEYRQDIYDSLHWLGLDWDTEAPTQLGRQGEYSKYLQMLDGKLYPCACSRKTIQTNTKQGLYGQTCLPQALTPVAACLQAEFNYRLHVPTEVTIMLKDALKGNCVLKPAELAGDLIVWRKHHEPAYQLASVVDDIEAGINFIVRGEDLWSSTAFQLYIASLLGVSAFTDVTFLHHGLITDEAGKKLSKSDGATSLLDMREKGISKQYLYQRFAHFWEIDVSTLPTLSELMDNLPARLLP